MYNFTRALKCLKREKNYFPTWKSILKINFCERIFSMRTRREFSTIFKILLLFGTFLPLVWTVTGSLWRRLRNACLRGSSDQRQGVALWCFVFFSKQKIYCVYVCHRGKCLWILKRLQKRNWGFSNRQLLGK